MRLKNIWNKEHSKKELDCYRDPAWLATELWTSYETLRNLGFLVLSLKLEKIKPLCHYKLREILFHPASPMLDLKPDLLLNIFPRQVDGKLTILASQDLYSHRDFYNLFFFFYKYKLIVSKGTGTCSRFQQIQINFKALLFVQSLPTTAIPPGSSTSRLIERQWKAICYEHISPVTLTPLGWADLGGPFQYLLAIEKSFTLTWTIFHLWLTLPFPLYSPPCSVRFSPVISLKCLRKNCVPS